MTPSAVGTSKQICPRSTRILGEERSGLRKSVGSLRRLVWASFSGSLTHDWPPGNRCLYHVTWSAVPQRTRRTCEQGWITRLLSQRRNLSLVRFLVCIFITARDANLLDSNGTTGPMLKKKGLLAHSPHPLSPPIRCSPFSFLF